MLGTMRGWYELSDDNLTPCGRVSGSREKGERSPERAEGVGVGGEGRSSHYWV